MGLAQIEVRGLRKSYGGHEAVRGIDLHVEQGEIFAFLGPNGAGKTTTVEILEGYRTSTSGQVEVLGRDPYGAPAGWRARIGVVLQSCQLEPLLTVAEAMRLYAGYYPSPRPVDETIELVGLADQRSQRTGKLSGGQQRRLDVGLALVGDPDLLFLDEPTTGFDPAARRDAWQTVAGLRELGKTVFMTTHYMDEAQALADRVAIIKDGVIVAEGTPAQLGAGSAGLSSVTFALPPPAGPADLPPSLASRVSPQGVGLGFTTSNPVADLADLCRWALGAGVDLDRLEVRRPSLEDVYLDLTTGP